ncbi:MAG: phage head-tail adapter protein [Eubacteriales bacterium]|nr:phage head-tail adapter protein [Eubacteriales bacterium]
MNQEWSELNKAVQTQLKKEATFVQGIETLLTLRQALMDELLRMKEELSGAEFCVMPFPKANGYHSKTIAYSIWHIFRIEDIVANSLIRQEKEVLDTFQEKIGAPIITTGNELADQQIVDFSKELDLDALYAYAAAVKFSTDVLLKQLSYRDLNRRFEDADKARLRSLQVVSPEESACWLIDFWCGKNIRGLVQMPFSRHWIMHIEASIRIENKIHKQF